MNDEIDWSKITIPVQKLASLSIGNINPSYTMTFHRDGKTLGTIDWNGPEMKFSGDLDYSAKLLFELLAKSFKGRLEQERALEREAIAQMIEDAPALVSFAQNDKGGCLTCGFTPKLAANSIRMRGKK